MISSSFRGDWISDMFGKISLEQRDVQVQGRYTAMGGGSLQGRAHGNHLDFIWQNVQQEYGWGTIRMISGGRTLTGFWGYNEDKEQMHLFLAEFLTAELPPVVSEDGQLTEDAMEIKYQGYNLFLRGHYREAVPLLEQALQLYRARLQQSPADNILRDSYLIDIVNITTRLLRCHFMLTDYQYVAETPDTRKQQQVHYQQLLAHIHIAMHARRELLRREVQQHIERSLVTFSNVTSWLQDWVEQLAQYQLSPPDPRFARLQALKLQLGLIYEKLTAASQRIATYQQRQYGLPESVLRVLSELADLLAQLSITMTSDLALLRTLTARWPDDQRALMEQLMGLLSTIPLELEGQERMARQAQQGAQEIVGANWEAIMGLSQRLEEWRLRLWQDLDRIDAQEQGQPFFSELIRLFVEFENTTEALVISERARARAYLDLLALQGSVPASAAELVPPVTLTDIHEIVSARDSVTLEYFIMEQYLLIWIILPTGQVSMVTFPIEKNHLEEMVGTCLALIEQDMLERTQRTELSEILQKLYTVLIAPVPCGLLPKEADDVITVIPHGALFQVPFAALQKDAKSYFIEEHALCYAPSIHILKYTRRNLSRVCYAEQAALLAIVNPHPFVQSDLPPLTFIEENFENITEFYPHQDDTQEIIVLSGMDAQKHLIRQHVEHATVLLFATHGKAFNKQPQNSYLALAATVAEDGYLRPPDIADLNLHAELVILLACETANGEITGDGVNGLSRAFLVAGAASLLLSLWKVPETMSMEQIWQFHLHWRGRSPVSKVRALRKAQCQCLANNQDEVRAWAMFTLNGEL